AGAAALLVTAYRLARSGLVVLAVALAAPFLGLALVLAGPDLHSGAVPVARGASVLWAAGPDTRVLAVLLAAAIPVAAVAALVRGGGRAGGGRPGGGGGARPRRTGSRRDGGGPATAAGPAAARRAGGRGAGSIGQRGQAHHVRTGDPARSGRGTGRLPHRPGG